MSADEMLMRGGVYGGKRADEMMRVGINAASGPFDDVPLRVDLSREGEEGHTGIYVRAMRDNIPGSYDIATLDRDSLFRWLRSRPLTHGPRTS